MPGIYLWDGLVSYQGVQFQWLVVEIYESEGLHLRYLHRASSTAWYYNEELDSIASRSFSQNSMQVATSIIAAAGLVGVQPSQVANYNPISKEDIVGLIAVAE